MFETEAWLCGDIRISLNSTQRDIYISLISMSARRKNGYSGFIAWDNHTPPKYPYNIKDLATRINCHPDLLSETLDTLSKLNRITVDNDGIIRIIKWDAFYPPLDNKGYSKLFDIPLKDRIRERDNYVCQRCDITEIALNEGANIERNLTIHHINYDTTDTNDYNLISLCTSCNFAVNTHKNYWKKHFTDKLRERGIYREL
jgi:hypothetical protein